MSKDVLCRRRQEEKIKHHLCNIELQEAHTSNTFRPHYFQMHKRQLPRKNSDFPELSDWNTHIQKYEYPLLQTQAQGFSRSNKDRKKFSFLSNTKYSSSLLSPKNEKKQRLQLNPNLIRFNAKILSQNLQKSKQKYVEKLKEHPYITQYQSMTLLQEKKKKKREQSPKFREVEAQQIRFEGDPNQQRRMTGILKLLKKDVPYRIRPKRPLNPETQAQKTMYMFS